jgi:WD40 repeat protein
VESAVFSPDGAGVLTASRDNTARVWRVFATMQDLVGPFCRAA